MVCFTALFPLWLWGVGAVNCVMTTTIKNNRPIFEVSNWYFEASFPYGRPIHPRKICYISSIAKCKELSVLGIELSLSLWIVTVYDDKPRTFNVRDGRGTYFQTNSWYKVLEGIKSRCDENGKLI